MKPARLILLLVALVAGGLAAFLVMRGNRPLPQTATTEVVVAAPQTQVLVAATPVGVGQRLAPENLQWQDWPESALRPEYVTIAAMPDAPAELTGAVARFEIFPGEPIRDAKLVRSDQGYLSAVLSEGMRGVSVPVTAASSAGGFIIPNDHVDVVLTRVTEAGEQSEVILSNVRVLAIGKRLGELGTTGGGEDPNAPAPTPLTFDDNTIATLELTPSEAESLINSASQGQLSLTLRSVVDFNDDTVAAKGSSTNSTVRVIRFGREQAIQAGATDGGSTASLPQPVNQPITNQPVTGPIISSAPTQPTPAAEPQVLPQ